MQNKELQQQYCMRNEKTLLSKRKSIIVSSYKTWDWQIFKDLLDSKQPWELNSSKDFNCKLFKSLMK